MEKLKLLIVDDSKLSLDFFSEIAKKEDFEIKTATNGKEGLIEYNNFKPSIIITDIQMPEMNGLELLKAIREKDKEVVIIMATSIDSENYVIEALKNKANYYFKKSNNENEIIEILRRYKRIINDEKDFKEQHLYLEKMKCNFIFDNNIYNVNKYVNFIVKPIRNIFDKYDLITIKGGLIELLINAIEHGNMGITFEEKSSCLEKSENELIDLYNRKINDPEIINKKVRVFFEMDRSKLEWDIEDEGKGFDWQSFIIKRSENKNTLHGRGYFITQTCFDYIEYIGKGNKVKVIKYRKK